jgi:hypothetical protein
MIWGVPPQDQARQAGSELAKTPMCAVSRGALPGAVPAPQGQLGHRLGVWRRVRVVRQA